MEIPQSTSVPQRKKRCKRIEKSRATQNYNSTRFLLFFSLLKRLWCRPPGSFFVLFDQVVLADAVLMVGLWRELRANSNFWCIERQKKKKKKNVGRTKWYIQSTKREEEKNQGHIQGSLSVRLFCVRHWQKVLLFQRSSSSAFHCQHARTDFAFAQVGANVCTLVVTHHVLHGFGVGSLQLRHVHVGVM